MVIIHTYSYFLSNMVIHKPKWWIILSMFFEKELLARSEIMIWFKLVWFMKLDSLTKATTCDSCSEASEGSKIGRGGNMAPLCFYPSFYSDKVGTVRWIEVKMAVLRVQQYMPWNQLLINVLNDFWYFKHQILTTIC